MDGVTNTQHTFGRGFVYSGLTLNEILTRLHAEADFASSGSPENPPAWVHRHLPDADIFFVVNQSDKPLKLDLRVRVSGDTVELWKPMDGSIEATPFTGRAAVDEKTSNGQSGLQPAVYTDRPGFTTVLLALAPREALFVVIRR